MFSIRERPLYHGDNPMAAPASKKPFTVSGPEKLVVCPCKFRPLESNKYLNVDALSTATKATIEIGTVDTSYGTRASSRRCERAGLPRCGPWDARVVRQNERRARPSLKKLSPNAAYRVAPLDKRHINLPMPIKKASIKNTGLGIVIGPIIILGPGNPTNPRSGCIYIGGPSGACRICDGFTCCVTPTDPHP